MLEPIQQGKLIDKDGPQGEPLRVDQALGQQLAVAILLFCISKLTPQLL
jgi:hypothetical protein